MKKEQILVLAIILLTILSGSILYLYIADLGSEQFLSSQNNEGAGVITDLDVVDGKDHLEMDEYFTSLPSEDLTQEEIDGLLLMREEEKLAHDVYTALYDQWGQKIFNNISESEQTHTDMVAELIDKYDLVDPVKTNDLGAFTNPEMEKLYNELVELGSGSIIGALKVGATVEDLDIYDLDTLMVASDNEDILAVYQNLQKGSRNHLRAYVRMLNRNGSEYSPKYISQSQYEEIIESASENGVLYDAQGNKR